MKRQLLGIVTIILLLYFVGCSPELTVDGSTEGSLNTSISRMESELSPDRREDFRYAIIAITLDGIGGFSSLAENPTMAAMEATQYMREQLDGKTVDEVIEMAQPIIEAASEENGKPYLGGSP